MLQSDDLEDLERAIESVKKQVQDATKLFNTKADLLKSYAKKLDTMRKSNGNDLLGMMSKNEAENPVLLVIKKFEYRTAMLYGLMEQEIRDKVVEVLENQKTRSNNVSKNALSDIEKIEKEYKDCLNRIQKSQIKYYKCRDDSADVEHILETEELNQIEENMLASEMSEKQRDVIESRDTYMSAIKQARTCKLQGGRQLAKLKESLISIEKERIENFYLSMNRYVEIQENIYSLILNESKACLEMLKQESFEDIQYPKLDVNLSDMPTFEDWQPSTKKSGINELLHFFKKPSSKSNENMKTETPKENDEDQISKSECEASDLHRSYWVTWLDHQLNCDESADACNCNEAVSKELALDLLSERIGRRAFVQILTMKRSQNSGLIKGSKSLRNIVQAIIYCLNQIVEKEANHGGSPKSMRSTSIDLSCVKDIMIVSQTLYFYQETNQDLKLEEELFFNSGSTLSDVSPTRKFFLSACIRHHSIWKSDLMWEDLLFESIQNEKLNRRMFKIEPWLSNEEIHSLQEINSNVVFGQIANIAHSMLLMGNTTDQVQAFIMRNSKFYELRQDQLYQIIETVLPHTQ